jgi:hypothetical protein
MKSITAIKTYFESDPHGRKVTMDELKGLTPPERAELGRLACVELGEPFEESVSKAA